MVKRIIRPNIDIDAFAANAQGTERTVFGSTTQADDLETNLNADFFRGWGIVPTGGKPTKQDFNGFAYTVTRLISYIYQIGIPEYAPAQVYHDGSYCRYGSTIYRSLIKNNQGNQPDISPAQWSTQITPYATKSIIGSSRFATDAEAIAGVRQDVNIAPDSLYQVLLTYGIGTGAAGNRRNQITTGSTDDVTQTGVYHVSGIANIPQSTDGILVVFAPFGSPSGDTRAIQLFVADDATTVWIRKRFLGVYGAWELLSGRPPVLEMSQTEPSGTSGQTSVAGSYITRILNSIDKNTITGANLELTTSRFTLPAGTFRIEWRAPCGAVGLTGDGVLSHLHKSKLQSISGDSVVVLGSSGRGTVDSVGRDEFTLSQTTVFEIQHYNSTSSVNGFGYQTNNGDSEIYTQVKIERI
jgi:hypothetical protein